MTFEHKEYGINSSMYEDKSDFRLEKTYELCVAELGLQQSKRDQILAFYIAVISFVFPSIIKLENEVIKSFSCIALYVLGLMFVLVVIRYRIYKEVYWITCRTISQLYCFKESAITKDLVQHIFYHTMCKNAHSVIDTDDTFENINFIKTCKKMLNSADTILFEVLVIISSGLLLVSYILYFGSEKLDITIAIGLAVLSTLYCNYLYYKSMMKIYSVVTYDANNDTTQEESDELFNATYNKAWFLHGFYRYNRTDLEGN